MRSPGGASAQSWSGSDSDGDRGRPVRAPDMAFQPLVELDGGAVVGFEALARDGRTGAAEAPTRLFAEARDAGRLVELDWACRTAALERARAIGLGDGALHGAALLVNTEPQAAGSPPPPDHVAAEGAAPTGMVRVLELTERALALRLGPLLDLVDGARSRGWRIAVDDVGAHPAQLSLLPILQPDVIKLDLHLVQRRTGTDAAELINAVAVQRATTGALVVVEGIETSADAELARSMGAQLGQGHLFGRPGPLSAIPAVQAVSWPQLARPQRRGSPWQQLPPDAPVRRVTQPQLLAIARWLERQAETIGEAAVVLATVPRSERLTPSAALRYEDLARSASIVGVLAQHLPPEPVPGVRWGRLSAGDPLTAERDVVVIGPHFAGALLAHDLGDTGPDSERRFDYVLTYDRPQVLAAAADLLRRLPDLADPATPPPAARDPKGSATVERPPTELAPVLATALAMASDGLAISDATQPDLPLVYVNPAYERLSGYPAEALLGRNPRVLQAPETDPDAVLALQAAVAAGREVRVALLNARPDGTRWWNELHLLPVHDGQGRLTHWIGTQQDVTGRMDAQEQAAYLAHHDPLTGLANRRRLVEYLPAEIGRASRTGTSLALLYLDLDRFKDVNDRYGHAAGDELLAEVAARLRLHRRVGDLLVRQGGDEFLLVLSGLPHDRERACAAARLVADKVHAELRRPFVLGEGGSPVVLAVSIGISHCPYDAQDAAKMLEHADRALYEVKRQGRGGTRTFGRGLSHAADGRSEGQASSPRSAASEVR